MQIREFEGVHAVQHGTLAEARLTIGHLASGAPIAIPLIIARGRKDGPCLWINGQIHGDELNCVFAAIDFVRGLPLAELSGTVIVSSTANPLAMDVRQRRTPFDGADMDQSFPGHRSGNTTERMASRLLEELHRYADCLVSLHTTMSAYDAVVFAAYKTPPAGSGVSEPLMLKCMGQFGPRFVLVMPDAARAADTTGHTHGSIDYQILAAGKPAFMIELGGGGRCDNDHVRQAVEGLYGTAALLGLIDRPVTVQGRLMLVRDFRSVTTRCSGLFRASVQPGAELKAGEVYGRIIDLYGRVVEEARFDRPTGLVALRRDPVIHFGERLCIAAVDYGSISF